MYIFSWKISPFLMYTSNIGAYYFSSRESGFTRFNEKLSYKLFKSIRNLNIWSPLMIFHNMLIKYTLFILVILDIQNIFWNLTISVEEKGANILHIKI